MSAKWAGGPPGSSAGASIRTRWPLSTPSSWADQPRLPALGQAGGAHGGEGLFGELGIGIEQGGKEHVARQTPQRVEMEVAALPHAQAAGRYTGTT